MGDRGRSSNRIRRKPGGGGGAAGPAPGSAATPGADQKAAVDGALGQDGSKPRIGRANPKEGGGVEIRTYGTSLAPYSKKQRANIQAQRRATVEGALKPLGFGVKWDGDSAGTLVHR